MNGYEIWRADVLAGRIVRPPIIGFTRRGAPIFAIAGADNVTVDNGALTDYVPATDTRTINSVSVEVQRIVPIANTAMANGQVTVTNSATTIVAARETRQSVVIVNRQTVAVWVGIATVTTANGLRLDPGDAVTVLANVLIQGITSAAYSGTGDALVQYVETYDS